LRRKRKEKADFFILCLSSLNIKYLKPSDDQKKVEANIVDKVLCDDNAKWSTLQRKAFSVSLKISAIRELARDLCTLTSFFK